MRKHYFKSKNCLVYFLLFMVLPCNMMAKTTEPITTSGSFTVLAAVASTTVEAWRGGGKGGSKACNGNGGRSSIVTPLTGVNANNQNGATGPAGSGNGGSASGVESNGDSGLFPGGVFCVLLIQDGTSSIKKMSEKLVFLSPILK
jgi:hypothetical protein